MAVGTNTGWGRVRPGLAAASPAGDDAGTPEVPTEMIHVNAYTTGGMVSGTLARPGALKDALEDGRSITLEDPVWQALGPTNQPPAGSGSIATDDVLVAVGDEAPDLQVHMAWHHVRLESGPYTIEGELATMPGFDPGRALARPSGEFLLLRDIRLSVTDEPDGAIAVGDHALINRYAVERIQADLMLGFFFPGAAVDPLRADGAPGDVER